MLSDDRPDRAKAALKATAVFVETLLLVTSTQRRLRASQAAAAIDAVTDAALSGKEVSPSPDVPMAEVTLGHLWPACVLGELK